MTIDKDDAELFFELFFPLLNYVNKELNIIPQIRKFRRGVNSDPMLLKKIANGLWNDVDLVDSFLEKNGGELSEDERQIIMSWKRRVTGKFVLERHLKSGSVFIDMKTEEVYLVKGLLSSWEEMIPKYALPIALDATLLPFKNAIVSDGLVAPYNVAFGKNYRDSFKNHYMTAKKSGLLHKSI